MSFLAVKLLKLGYSQAKKYKAKQQQQPPQQQQFHHAGAPGYPPYPTQYPQQPYPMTEYPPGLAPGTNLQYPPPAEPAPAEQPSKGAKLGSMFTSGLRFLQFALGLAVIGLYGKDVHHDHEAKHTWHAKWLFALITGFLATATAAVHLIVPFCVRRVKYAPRSGLRLPQFVWEFVLCVLWLTLFGIFGKMYIGVYPTSNSAANASKKDSSSTAGLGDASKIDRMRNAVWVDVANLALWVFTASWVLLRWLKSRHAATGAAGDAEKVEGV